MGTIIDMTFGGGGHSQMILQRAASLKLIAADRDPLAFRLAQSLSQQCTGFPDDPTAADVVNNLDANDLHSVFRGYGEERLSRSIAQAIVDARYAFGNITRTQQLAKIVDTVFEG
nr:hypothetical protein BaRGS_033548 [Batillaria attramentaria]